MYAGDLRGEALGLHQRTSSPSTKPTPSLKMLALIDAALVASLVVMVIISGYENYVSRFDDGDAVRWAGRRSTPARSRSR